MAKMIKPKGRKVSGDNYVEVDEKYNRKMDKKEVNSMKTAGIANELKESEKEQGYSKKPRVKGQKKNAKPVGLSKKKVSY